MKYKMLNIKIAHPDFSINNSTCKRTRRNPDKSMQFIYKQNGLTLAKVDVKMSALLTEKCITLDEIVMLCQSVSKECPSVSGSVITCI